MILQHLARIALENLVARGRRTLFLVLGVAIGTGTLTFLLAVYGGMGTLVQENLGEHREILGRGMTQRAALDAHGRSRGPGDHDVGKPVGLHVTTLPEVDVPEPRSRCWAAPIQTACPTRV